MIAGQKNTECVIMDTKNSSVAYLVIYRFGNNFISLLNGGWTFSHVHGFCTSYPSYHKQVVELCQLFCFFSYRIVRCSALVMLYPATVYRTCSQVHLFWCCASSSCFITNIIINVLFLVLLTCLCVWLSHLNCIFSLSEPR